MEEKILEKIESLQEQMFEDIRQLVRIDSVEADAQPGAPFGPGSKRRCRRRWSWVYRWDSIR